MPNYKDLYLKMFRASEQAIHLLIAAQQECEELYISSTEEEFSPETTQSTAEKPS